MKKIPKLQFALDYTSLPKAIAMAVTAAEPADIVEVGTPLCKAAGLQAIRGIREVCPEKLILADFKTPDVGALEAKMAFDAGADIMTVIGGAALVTAELALSTAQTEGKTAQIELTGVKNIVEEAHQWRKIGIDWMVYHRGWDEQGAGNREWAQEDLDTIQELIDMGFRVTISGGITSDSVSFFSGLEVEAIIMGRAIHQADDPLESAKALKKRVTELWG